jgi:hypothetical protein
MLRSAGSIELISAASSQENSSARGGLLSLILSDSRCKLWICHEANPRASMLPDLHHLTDAAGKPIPTNEEFWRSWITVGKADTLMPAFAISQGGPLNDIQIASLAAYLNMAYPSLVPSPPAR